MRRTDLTGQGLAAARTFALLAALQPLFSFSAVAQQVWERPAVLPVPGEVDVRMIRDVAYTSEAPEVRMDVYMPKGGDNAPAAPLVVLVHGGPLPTNLPVPAKNMAVFESYGRHLAARGVGAVVFSHRFTGLEAIPQADRDIAAAILYIGRNAATWGLDSSRMCIWAFSAGGIFVDRFLAGDSERVRCVVMYYTLVDAALYPEVGAGPLPAGVTGRYRVQLTEADGTDGPAVFVARAGRDRAVLNRELDRFVAEALAANFEMEVMNHPTGAHAFDVFNSDSRSREIIRRTLAFIVTRLVGEHDGAGNDDLD
jgi:acetyl esterase/lipase